MPEQLIKDIFKCVYCGKKFSDEDRAKHHEQFDHDIVYIQLERQQLNRLLTFLAAHIEDAREVLNEETWISLNRGMR